MKNPSIDDINNTNLSVDVYSDEQSDLIEEFTFNQTQSLSIVNSIKWHSSQDTLLVSDSKCCSVWNIGDGQVVCHGSISFTPHKAHQSYYSNPSDIVGNIAWDPHSENSFAAVHDTTLQIVDTREFDVSSKRCHAHSESIRDVDYNPNKPLMLLTAGNDRKIKFWDLRNLKNPVRTLSNGHSHWIWSARYNPFHDQLILSSGSDYLVNLWRVASCSSAPWIGSLDDNNHDRDSNNDESSSYESDPPDVKVRTIDQHEESVYAVAWSAADAWIYCSLSLDGRVLLNHVPSTEKYKILL